MVQLHLEIESITARVVVASTWVFIPSTICLYTSDDCFIRVFRSHIIRIKFWILLYNSVAEILSRHVYKKSSMQQFLNLQLTLVYRLESFT